MEPIDPGQPGRNPGEGLEGDVSYDPEAVRGAALEGVVLCARVAPRNVGSPVARLGDHDTPWKTPVDELQVASGDRLVAYRLSDTVYLEAEV